jgi:hypothetical protein
MAPVCGKRAFDVPTERITTATAPTFAARLAPFDRIGTVAP